MKKPSKSKSEESPSLTQKFPHRLAELETELREYPSSPLIERPLKSVEEPVQVAGGKEPIVQFRFHKKVYAVGHTDFTYSGAGHARGVRHIRFYEGEKTVLDIEGNYEDQQFGSNFQFQNIDLYAPGEWETDFVKLTDELHDFKTKRREAFRKKRVSSLHRLHRGRYL
ncbi:MAG: hypothetical protein WC859_08705 [Elusimicrobiota bacterium]